jgi:F-type H+-transporting ATPase subunit epsilon
MSINLRIVTPSDVAFEGSGQLITGPGFFGEFGVLKDHARFLTLNRAGLITLEQPGHKIQIVVGKGFAEVADNQITYLVDSCTLSEDIEGTIEEYIQKLNE